MYLPGHWHSTETSLLFTSDCILNALDHKGTTAVVLFKTSKAFDSISYEIVIIQQDIGLPSSAIRCLNYFALSDLLLMNWSIPLSSILRHLFIVYANDLPSIPQRQRTIMLTTLNSSGPSGSRTVNQLWLGQITGI
ncbi:hypothetical protein pdam_00006335 [Pocillopora damicornis]|uniref:Reverse transcriptase domain-containing protein n=1 Tax=Pocillopora damicornis TaxID=46731 RepID=A0A3M6TQI6_POCDA|nr:hypothetical protein pdam_00006335 [Pocillopora damicornis]